jgi:hypothetical protein
MANGFKKFSLIKFVNCDESEKRRLVTARCVTQVACTQRGRRKRRHRAPVHETGSVAIQYMRKASSDELLRALANRRCGDKITGS